MNTAESLLNTSVSDAKTSLQREVETWPHTTGTKALQMMADIAGKSGQVSRRKMLGGIVRQAGKLLEQCQEPHGRLARNGDPYIERTTNGRNSLGEYIDNQIEADPHNAAQEMLQALRQLSGPSHKTRRQQLRTGLGQAVRVIVDAA